MFFHDDVKYSKSDRRLPKTQEMLRIGYFKTN